MKKIIKGSFAMALIFAVLFIVSGCGSKSYTLEELSAVTVSGVNGNGTVYVSFDPGNKASEIMGAKGAQEGAFLLSSLKSDISYSCEPNNGLKNGDKIKVTASFDTTITDKLGINISPLEFTYEVKGLN